MNQHFDPYYEWLSIPPEDQPPNLYRMLGVKHLEANLQVLASAADRQMTHVRSFSTGPRGAIAQRVLTELSTARIMLLDPGRKAAYDAMLTAAAKPAEPPPAPPPTSAPQAVEQEIPAERGSRFGGYEVLQTISRAASGSLYKARRVSDGLIVSLKVVPPDLAKDEKFLKRLKREFELTRTLEHPQVVAGYEMGEVAGRPYLAFEYVGGADLGRVVAEHGPLDPTAALAIVRDVADGLEYLHGKGVVHRNLKPQNILVNIQGNVKIANLTMALEEEIRAYFAGREYNLTTQGEMLGSPDYIAPEQAADAHGVDGRADLYSLGCMLHHLLTGKPPYAGKNAMQKLQAHQTAPVPSLRQARPDVPEWLDELFQQLLAKKPGDRPANAAEVVQRLAGREEKQWNTTIVVVGVVTVFVLLFLLVLALLQQLG